MGAKQRDRKARRDVRLRLAASRKAVELEQNALDDAEAAAKGARTRLAVALSELRDAEAAMAGYVHAQPSPVIDAVPVAVVTQAQAPPLSLRVADEE